MKIALRAALLVAGVVAAALPPRTVFAEVVKTTAMVGVKRNMEATLFTPDGVGPFPAVLVFHTSQGMTEVDRQYCARLAREGFVCLAPAFLRAHGIRQETKEATFTTERASIMADFAQVIDEVNRLPKV